MKKNIYINEAISISDKEFKLMSELIYEKFGINLTDNKKPLLVNRLQRILKNAKMKSFSDYYQYILDDKSGDRSNKLIDAVSTNHTFFFREKNHFDFLIQNILPDLTKKLVRSVNPDIRIWCAAASTGEEPYGLVMVLKEYFGKLYTSWIRNVLATDISNQVLSEAITGIYPERKIEHTPEIFKKRYFNKVSDDEYAISQNLKKEVSFRSFNLMSKRFPFKKPFHIIFCRNVMIYFDQQTRENLIHQFSKVLVTGGYLFIGNAESLGKTFSNFRYVAPSIYQKV